MADSLITFLDEIIEAAEKYKVTLAQPTPDPIPDPVPDPDPIPPPPTTGDRQPIFAWVGVLQLGQLDLASMAGALDGFVHMIHEPGGFPNGPHPDWLRDIKRAQDAGFEVRTGCYVAGQGPDQVARYLSAWPGGHAIDLEPYGDVRDDYWNAFAPADYRRNGRVIGGVVDDLIVYPSSKASWPGSYNDLIQTQAGRPNTYATNGFPDFVEGLMETGCHVTLLDASFHWGPQLRGDTWATGITRTVQLAGQRFPTAGAAPMLWPDRQEGPGPFPVGDMLEAFRVATGVSTGPVVLYQHTLPGGEVSRFGPYPWNALFQGLRALRD